MSSSNTFKLSRFLQLFKQTMIHNNKLLMYSSVGYCGVVFLILIFGQLGNELRPYDLEAFMGFLAGFVGVFGILYVGYSFPAFRNKENATSYLLVPASIFEKFLFEFVNRIVIMLIVLPFLFWFTFNLEGLTFELFTGLDFNPIGISDLMAMDIPLEDIPFWAPILIVSASFLIFVLPFTGAAMFSKQPLVKTLFSVALIIFSYVGFVYLVVEPLGLGKYDVDESVMWLVPDTEEAGFRFFAFFAILTNLVMLSVTYLKLKEKEV